MNKLLKKSAALLSCLLGLCATALAAGENAKVTLTVTHFRTMNPVANTEFVDATTALVPHADVRLEHRKGMPTFLLKRAFVMEISLASADPTESYRPLGILFRQKADRAIGRADPEGKINFSSRVTPAGTIVVDHRFLQQGDDSRYQFFVLIQRISDGAIGIIDPDEENEPQ